ncbi:hypothetical protein, partial [Actinopolyspora mortivallis]|uniref:hypothetical protein n=1 Tax=Actinopolyspora mortivallis TaxID=33906 RepID=UPI0005240E92
MLITGGFGRSIAADLEEVGRMDRAERARVLRDLRRNHPLYRTLSIRVALARATGFTSGLALAVAVVLLVQGAGLLWVSGFVLAGLFGFAYVVIRLTDSRFDLLLAVLGAQHRVESSPEEGDGSVERDVREIPGGRNTRESA